MSIYSIVMANKKYPPCIINNALKSRYNQNPCGYMAATTTLKIIGSKWKVLILWKLFLEEDQRYSQLKSALGDISEKMLSQVLKEMVEDQLILRQEMVKKAPKIVYYSLTTLGKKLEPVLKEMIRFGEFIQA